MTRRLWVAVALGLPVFLLASFEQRDWFVAVQSYQLLENTLIPARLELTHQDLSLKLIVDSWSAGP